MLVVHEIYPYMYNYNYIDAPMLEKTKKEASISHFSSTSLDCLVLEDAVVLPFKFLEEGVIGGGVVTNKKEHISIIDTGEKKYNYSEEVKQKDIIAIHLGLFHPKWGHCITDNIKKMWFLFSSEYKTLKKENNIHLIYTEYEGFSLGGNFLELLTLLGIDVEFLIPITKATRYTKIYIPDDSFFLEKEQRYYTLEFKKLISNLCYPQKKKKFNKVYFTRTSFDGFDYGEKDIETFFRKIGYKIIAPEKYSFKEQIEILAHCKTFAATEGSIAHNSLFLQQGTEVIIIRKANYINSYQFPINELKDLKVTYIDAHLSIFNHHTKPWVGPFFMYVNEHLQRFSESKLYLNSFKLKNFIQYTKDAFLLDMKDRKNAENFYYEQLKLEILNSKRKRYRKIANKLFPALFPWKID